MTRFEHNLPAYQMAASYRRWWIFGMVIFGALGWQMQAENGVTAMIGTAVLMSLVPFTLVMLVKIWWLRSSRSGWYLCVTEEELFWSTPYDSSPIQLPLRDIARMQRVEVPDGRDTRITYEITLENNKTVELGTIPKLKYDRLAQALSEQGVTVQMGIGTTAVS